tara:strand:- start:17 stop:2104 length:2088 start_codon:yes stop_codon:yes gene_type:complete
MEVTKDITIRQALGIRNKATRPLKQAIEKAGRSLNDPWASLNDKEFLIKLGEVGNEAHFKELLSTQQELERQLAVKGERPFINVFGDKGVARSLTKIEDGKTVPLIAASRQARETDKFKGVPEGKNALPAIARGLSAIPDADADVRTALAFNALVPLRPGEVAQIRVEDFDFETGKFVDEWRRVNKLRPDFDLPPVSVAILRDAAEKAKAEGRDYVFLPEGTDTTRESKASRAARDKFVSRMTSALRIPGGVKDQFKEFEGITGKPVENAKQFRKLIPSIIVGQLGFKEEANRILGHDSLNDITDVVGKVAGKHYISPVITEAGGTTTKQALAALENLYAETLDLDLLNDIPAAFNVSASTLEIEGESPRLVRFSEGEDFVGRTQSMGTVTAVDAETIEARRVKNLAVLKEQTAVAEAGALRAELEAIETAEGITDEKIQAKLDKEQQIAEARAQRQKEISASNFAEDVADSDRLMDAFEEEYEDPTERQMRSGAAGGQDMPPKGPTKYVAPLAVGTGIKTALSLIPGPADAAMAGLESAYSRATAPPLPDDGVTRVVPLTDPFDIAVLKGQGFAEERGLPSSIGAMGGAGLQLLTGAVADPNAPIEGLKQLGTQMGQLFGAGPLRMQAMAEAAQGPQTGTTQGRNAPRIPDPVPAQTGALAAEGFADRRNTARSAAIEGKQTELVNSFFTMNQP